LNQSKEPIIPITMNIEIQPKIFFEMLGIQRQAVLVRTIVDDTEWHFPKIQAYRIRSLSPGPF
jgi:hypothetical protein